MRVKYMASQRKTLQADRRKRPRLWQRCRRRYHNCAANLPLLPAVRPSQDGSWIVRMGRLP